MTIQVIGTDGIASSNKTTSTSTNFMDYLAMGTSIAGPVTEASLLASGNTGAATIAGATANATYSSALTSSGSGSYLSTGSLGSTSSSYLTGGSSYLDSGTDIEQIMTDASLQQAEMIGIQVKIQNDSQGYQAISNALKSDSDTKLNAIRNYK